MAAFDALVRVGGFGVQLAEDDQGRKTEAQLALQVITVLPVGPEQVAPLVLGQVRRHPGNDVRAYRVHVQEGAGVRGVAKHADREREAGLHLMDDGDLPIAHDPLRGASQGVAPRTIRLSGSPLAITKRHSTPPGCTGKACARVATRVTDATRRVSYELP